MRRTIRAVVVAAIVASMPAAVLAQDPRGGPPSVIADPDILGRELDIRANADRICWNLGDPLTVDWLAELDAGFRRGVYDRYHLEEIDGGWRWVRKDASGGPDLRAADAADVEGIGYTALEAHPGAEGRSGWASFDVDSALSVGGVRFEWTPPPARLCMADGLNLKMSITVEEGTPGTHRALFVVPLSDEQKVAEGPEVKACSPAAATEIDSELGLNADTGECARELYHIIPGSKWYVWVSLPSSFYVIYPYEPETGKRRR